MHHFPWTTFATRLTPAQRALLLDLKAQARHSPPADWTAWGSANVHLGHLSAERAGVLKDMLAPCRWRANRLVWDVDGLPAAERSALLQATLERSRELGLLPGWRNERFSFWSAANASADPGVAPFLSVERSGFRFLGMMSHAVHINGFLADGRVWCGRRALQKATDPGLLDNVTAGGLPTGETILQCALRELEEEAGLTHLTPAQLHGAGGVRISRVTPAGWHDETLHILNVLLPDDCQPVNRDGEVVEFLCLEPAELLEQIRAGEFTADAALALAQGVYPH